MVHYGNLQECVRQVTRRVKISNTPTVVWRGWNFQFYFKPYNFWALNFTRIRQKCTMSSALICFFTSTVKSIKYGNPETASGGDISSIIKCSSQKYFTVRIKLRLFGWQQWKTWEFHKLRGIKLGPGFMPAAEGARPRSQLRQMKQIQACALRCTLDVDYGLCSVKQ
jgi:hypothetical protein